MCVCPLVLHDNLNCMSTVSMSSKDLLHSVNNQLTVVMAQAELLARQVKSEQNIERCREIKQAASKINRLLRAFVADAKDPNF